MNIRLLETTIDQLAHNVSGITKNALSDRESTGNSNIEFGEAEFDGKNLTLVFYAESTHGDTQYIASTDFDAPNGYYTLILKFYKAKSLRKLDNFKYTDMIAKIKEVIHTCDVRVHSDDPSFFYQGFWEDLDKKGLAIYKFQGEDGDGVWRDRHYASGGLTSPYIRLTKHLSQLINEIDDFIVEIGFALTDRSSPTQDFEIPSIEKDPSDKEEYYDNDDSYVVENDEPVEVHTVNTPTQKSTQPVNTPVEEPTQEVDTEVEQEPQVSTDESDIEAQVQQEIEDEVEKAEETISDNVEVETDETKDDENSDNMTDTIEKVQKSM